MNIEQLRDWCIQLPAVTEDIKWDNDLCFSVGGKMFCVTALEPPFKISFKVPDSAFADFTARPHIIPAPYMARAKWVCVLEPNALSPNEWRACLLQSYELVKNKLTRKLRNELGLH